MHGRVGGIGLLLPMLVCPCGCDDARPAPVAAIRQVKDAPRTGTIRGRVIWEGEPPAVPAIRGNVLTSIFKHDHIVRPNPHAPVINPADHGVREAVVFLRRVDAACFWDHPPVRIEQRDFDIHIHQGRLLGKVGFVRTGDSVEVVSRDKQFHALRGRGAEVFTLPFVDANQTTRRNLDRAGIVELSSGAGYTWMHAHLFVADHPYYTRTDDSGAFTIPGVPVGEHELVCWMPNWHIARHERHPETGHAERLLFATPLEMPRRVELEPSATVQVDFMVTAAQFPK